MSVAGVDEARLRKAFLEEAEELCQKLGDSLLALETDRGNSDLVNEVFRLTHSLKSEAALMGFAALSELAHRMEDVLGHAREGRLVLEKPVMDGIFAGSDMIAEMMAAISKGGSDADFDTSAILQELSRTAGRGGKSPSETAAASTPGTHAVSEIELSEFEKRQLTEARDRGEALYKLAISVEPAEPMKFPRVYLVFFNLELVSNVVKVVPPMNGEPEEDARYATTTMLVTSAGGDEGLRAAAAVDQIASLRIDRCDYDGYLVSGRSGSAATWQQGRPERAGGAAGAAAGMPHPERGAMAAGAAGGMLQAAAAVEKTSIRVDTRKLDDLWSLIAELVLHKSHIARLSDDLGHGADVHTVREELVESFDSLDKISSGMQQVMMDTRMIPISVIFSKFPRLVRDLSRKLGKPVELILSGEETEIDRSLVEALSDPLTHIIRNSLDHGIEFPEERVRRGKSEKGRVSVSARRQGGNIVIELADDGRGMDSEQIRRKALEMGIPGAANFNEAQLLELVFLPGFSTKEVVTDLSGRGVGMDVVGNRIRGELKGDVVLGTQPGGGTRVTLLFPLTLTIVNALLVRGDSQLYAIPLTDVDSTVKLLATEIRGEEGSEYSSWMDDAIPVFSLGALFGKGRHKTEEYFSAVLRHGDSKAFLVVDELIEERDIVIKPVDDLLNTQRLFSGVSVLEDGRLVFILDTSFIRRERV
jgi:two-component system chemotaxis sensor kinase CheA